jgi:C1A family cysteine protease
MSVRKDVRLGWIKDLPDHRDFIFKPIGLPADLPAAVDLSQRWKVPVVDQGQLGSCTGNGIASALAFLQLIEGEPLVYPSRLFIYYNERVIEGSVTSDAGAEIRDGIKSIVDSGYCAETEWPYDINQFDVRPSDSAYVSANKDLVTVYRRVAVDPVSIMSAIALGYPVIVGFTVYDSFMTSTDGNIPMPKQTEGVQGGHAVIVVGYDQVTRRFKFENSWGTSWGTDGYGTLPFEYLGSIVYGGDYWIVTSDESAGPPPAPIPPPTPAPTPTPVPNGCNPFGNLMGLFGGGGG